MLETMKRKNHDYSGGDKESSPFRNFELVEAAGIATREQAILVRISDKLSRANTLLNSQALVLDESFQDTCLDAANYFIILALAYKDMEDTVHKSISSLIDTDIIGNLKRMKKDDEERQKKDVLDAT